MRPVFRSTQRKDQTALRDFLGRIFPSGDDSLLLDPALMEWKYWQSRPDWNGSRGYIVERDGAIVAHGAAWPLFLDLEDGPVRGFFWIDWAADPSIPGIGAALMRRVSTVGGVVWGWGGTPEALKMRSAMGFVPRNAVPLLARPLRPFRQALVRGDRSWKAIPHLGRNVVWSLARAHPASGWSAVAVDEDQIAATNPTQRSSTCGMYHFVTDSALLRYLAECPVARLQSFQVRHYGMTKGSFVLTYVPGQVRVAYAWIDDDREEAWQALYSLALQEAKKDTSICEMTTWCDVTVGRRALEQLGFRERDCHALMVYDPAGKAPMDGRFHLQMLHGDGAFLRARRTEFVT